MTTLHALSHDITWYYRISTEGVCSSWIVDHPTPGADPRLNAREIFGHAHFCEDHAHIGGSSARENIWPRPFFTKPHPLNCREARQQPENVSVELEILSLQTGLSVRFLI